jgi:hypothetical protein
VRSDVRASVSATETLCEPRRQTRAAEKTGTSASRHPPTVEESVSPARSVARRNQAAVLTPVSWSMAFPRGAGGGWRGPPRGREDRGPPPGLTERCGIRTLSASCPEVRDPVWGHPGDGRALRAAVRKRRCHASRKEDVSDPYADSARPSRASPRDARVLPELRETEAAALCVRRVRIREREGQPSHGREGVARGDSRCRSRRSTLPWPVRGALCPRSRRCVRLARALVGPASTRRMSLTAPTPDCYAVRVRVPHRRAEQHESTSDGDPRDGVLHTGPDRHQ